MNDSLMYDIKSFEVPSKLLPENTILARSLYNFNNINTNYDLLKLYAKLLINGVETSKPYDFARMYNDNIIYCFCYDTNAIGTYAEITGSDNYTIIFYDSNSNIRKINNSKKFKYVSINLNTARDQIRYYIKNTIMELRVTMNISEKYNEAMQEFISTGNYQNILDEIKIDCISKLSINTMQIYCANIENIYNDRYFVIGSKLDITQLLYLQFKRTLSISNYCP